MYQNGLNAEHLSFYCCFWS